MKCDRCGAPIWRVATKLGSLETWECVQCGARIPAGANGSGRGDSVPSDSLHLPELQGAWLLMPSQERVQRAEALLPSLERLTLAQHLQRYLDKAGFSLGRISSADRQEIDRELGDVGIEILGD